MQMVAQLPTENYYKTPNVENDLLNNKLSHRALTSVLNREEKSECTGRSISNSRKPKCLSNRYRKCHLEAEEWRPLLIQVSWWSVHHMTLDQTIIRNNVVHNMKPL